MAMDDAHNPKTLACKCKEELARTRSEDRPDCRSCLALAHLAFDLREARAMDEMNTLLRPPTLKLLEARGSSPEDAGDIYQDSLIKLLKMIPSERTVDEDFPTWSRFKKYAKLTALRCQTDHFRRSTRSKVELNQDTVDKAQEDPQHQQDSDDFIHTEGQLAMLVDLIDEHVTDPIEKLVVELRHFEAFSPAKIAELHPAKFPGGAEEISKIVERVKKRLQRHLPPDYRKKR